MTTTLPKLRLVALTANVGTAAFNSRANVCEMPAALAVNVTDWEEVTAETGAEKLAVVAPEATVTEAGTVTAELLLARFTANPLLAAAALRLTVHASVPAPVADAFEQVNPDNTGMPLPESVTVLELPDAELLVSVNAPVAAPDVVGSN